jgi:hypothetical protein
LRVDNGVVILVFDEVFGPQIQANNIACILSLFFASGIKAELSIIPVCSSYDSHTVNFESMKVFPRFLVAE